MAKSNPFAVALEGQKPQPITRAPKVRNANAIPSRQGKIGQTLYLPVDAHAALKDICREQEVAGEIKTIQSLLREGTNLVLQHYGKKPIA